MTNDLNAFSKTLVKDLNYIASKVQIHFLLHTALCFKYSKNESKYRFNFLKLNIKETYIDKIGFIYFWRNNVLIYS